MFDSLLSILLFIVFLAGLVSLFGLILAISDRFKDKEHGDSNEKEE